MFDGWLVLYVDNMFCCWWVLFDGVLSVGDYVLQVIFYLLIICLQLWLVKQFYVLLGEFDFVFGDELFGCQVVNYVCKVVYQFGWDWGLCFVIQGIWQDVWLEVWSGWCLEDFYVEQFYVDVDCVQLQVSFIVCVDVVGLV